MKKRNIFNIGKKQQLQTYSKEDIKRAVEESLINTYEYKVICTGNPLRNFNDLLNKSYYKGDTANYYNTSDKEVLNIYNESTQLSVIDYSEKFINRFRENLPLLKEVYKDSEVCISLSYSKKYHDLNDIMNHDNTFIKLSSILSVLGCKIKFNYNTDTKNITLYLSTSFYNLINIKSTICNLNNAGEILNILNFIPNSCTELPDLLLYQGIIESTTEETKLSLDVFKPLYTDGFICDILSCKYTFIIQDKILSEKVYNLFPENISIINDIVLLNIVPNMDYSALLAIQKLNKDNDISNYIEYILSIIKEERVYDKEKEYMINNNNSTSSIQELLNGDIFIDGVDEIIE